ncbi:MAG TPA: acetoin dehydrogenase dihydrolipoyllysine-residue acetyltransferase subunit [Caulobacteraceae bacterium]|nr:acetoin dehydrogenase dihydrolipoyllysine-residue acetyltransferase subunit [Caulobacteraceae bacterium]
MSAEPSAGGVIAIRMPKWGLSMEEGQVVGWLKTAGDRFVEGEELVEIETAKITNVYEAPASGLLRRIVAGEGETVPVGGLIAVAAEADTPEAEIDAFVTAFHESFVPASGEGGGPALKEQSVEAGPYRLNLGLAGEGEGQAVVLIHGFASNARSWELNLDALAGRGRVTVELPGHGASSKNVEDGEAAGLARAVAAALETVGVERAHLVGHSLGAAVALRMALAEPARFCSLTLVAPAGLPGARPDRAFLEGIVEGQRPRDLKPLLERLFHEPALVSQEMVEEMARYKRIDGVEESLAVLRDRLVEDEPGPDPSALSALPRTLVVLGADDRVVSPPDAEALPQTWRVVTLDNAGHMPHVEQAAAFNRLLIAFLDESA